jgi:hypothetical protein
MNPSSTFNFRFWKAFGMTVMVCFTLVAGWWVPQQKASPARPSFPFVDKYVSYYEPAGSAEHYLFFHGLLGFGERIKDADLILMGTSHTIFGMSAARIQEKLSARAGKPVRVFNMGMVYGEGAIFSTDVLARNEARGKTVVVDVYTEYPDGISPEARASEGSDILMAYTKVFKIWGHYTADWIEDPYLPSWHLDKITDEGFGAQRQLGNTLFRRFESGDNAGVWISAAGERYFSLDAHPLGSGDPFAGAPNRSVGFPEAARTKLLQLSDRVFLVAIPFEGSNKSVMPKGYSVLNIPPTGLAYIDQHHVNAASAKVVSDRIVDELLSSGASF